MHDSEFGSSILDLLLATNRKFSSSVLGYFTCWLTCERPKILACRIRRLRNPECNQPQDSPQICDRPPAFTPSHTNLSGLSLFVYSHEFIGAHSISVDPNAPLTCIRPRAIRLNSSAQISPYHFDYSGRSSRIAT